MSKAEAIKVRTPPVRGQFVRLMSPKKGTKGKKDSYELTGITEKLTVMTPKNKETLKELMAAAKAALRAEFGDAAFTADGKPAEGYEWPFKDAGKKTQYDGFEEGAICFDMKTVLSVGVADATRGKDPSGNYPEAEAEDIYSGAYYVCTVEPYAYRPTADAPKKGVKLTLRSAIKVRDGERLDGHQAAGAEFAGLSEDDFEFAGADAAPKAAAKPPAASDGIDL